jgi:hypothetical protein
MLFTARESASVPHSAGERIRTQLMRQKDACACAAAPD